MRWWCSWVLTFVPLVGSTVISPCFALVISESLSLFPPTIYLKTLHALYSLLSTFSPFIVFQCIKQHLYIFWDLPAPPILINHSVSYICHSCLPIKVTSCVSVEYTLSCATSVDNLCRAASPVLVKRTQCNWTKTRTLKLCVFTCSFRTTGLSVLCCGPQASSTGLTNKLIHLVVVEL